MDRFMKEIAKRKKSIQGLAIFLALMFFCTLLSKGIYSSKLTRVSTDNIKRMGISHLVETQGTVTAGKSKSVNTQSGLQVEELFVQRGDAVEPDTLLFQVSQEDLKDKIKEQELGIQKLELSIRSALENEALASIKDETSRKRADEDYVLSVDAAQEKINEAKEALDKAEDKLQTHVDNRVEVTSEEKRDKQESSYKDWKKKGSKLGNEVTKAEDNLTQAKEKLTDGTGTQAAVDAAEAALKNARKELSDYQSDERSSPDYSEEDMKLEAWRSERDALKEAVETAQKNYDAAVKDKESAIRNAQRALEDVQGNVTSDNTVESSQLELAYQREKLADFRALLQKEGKVYAKENGVITNIHIGPGDRTPDSSCMIYADTTEALQFEAVLTKDQKEYVDLGDTITVKFGNNNSEELKVDYLMPQENDSESWQLTCILPEGKGSVGQSATLTAQRMSEQYPCTIPIEALHGGDSQRNYVYVLEAKDTILGKELSAVQIWVSVLDKNDKYVALEPGLLDEESEIIISSDKELKDGDIVRYKE